MSLLRVLLILVLIILINSNSYAQVAINKSGNDPDSTAMLDVSSTENGLLIPRMTKVERLAIATPSVGLLVFQTDPYAGFYYWEGANWLLLAASEPYVWSQTWQVYGELYENNPTGTTIDLANKNLYYGWKTATFGDISGPGYVTMEDNPVADRIHIGALGGGTYLINVSVSFVGSNNNNVEGAVFINSVLQPELRYVTSISGNDRDAASLSGIINLTAGDYIHFAFSSNYNNEYVTLFFCNISITRISL